MSVSHHYTLKISIWFVWGFLNLVCLSLLSLFQKKMLNLSSVNNVTILLLYPIRTLAHKVQVADIVLWFEATHVYAQASTYTPLDDNQTVHFIHISDIRTLYPLFDLGCHWLLDSGPNILHLAPFSTGYHSPTSMSLRCTSRNRFIVRRLVVRLTVETTDKNKKNQVTYY